MSKLSFHQIRRLPGPILVTGHTGFKGTWLTYLLHELDIPFIGYALEPAPDSMRERIGVKREITEEFADIRDKDRLDSFIKANKPSAILHLAAQPLVLNSYAKALETFEINSQGTVNLLDSCARKPFVESVLVVTTDKVYENLEEHRRFKESDALRGKDPYSASKVAAEAAVAAWQQIRRISGGPKIVAARAGNVIGGGDFSQNRLIPDLVRSVVSGEQVAIRNPKSTRPWQHVLDPLFGYLLYLEKTLESEKFPESLNFGPTESSLEVKEVAIRFMSHFKKEHLLDYQELAGNSGTEAVSLELDPSQAIETLQWRPTWSQQESIDSTASWWLEAFQNTLASSTFTTEQIRAYLAVAADLNS